MSHSPADSDFLDHLQQSFAGDRETALSRLGAWLLSYEPKRRYELNFLKARARELSSPPVDRAA